MTDVSLEAIEPIELDITKTVKKSNLLNEMRNANASLVEYRLFCVYMAHLTMPKKNQDGSALTNVVKFRLSDYARIAGLKRPRAEDLDEQSDNLLNLKAKIPLPDGGFRKLTIFSEFALFKFDGEWMVSLEGNPNIVPMIREEGSRFVRYKLYNTIFLKSYNQQRLYELLKQYEKIGTRTVSLPDLRDFLSIEEDQYPIWGVFARDVLKKAQTALRENTDIYFDFEPIKANRKGKPVIAVKFAIHKNVNFIDHLQIDKHLQDIDDGTGYDGDEIRKKAPEEQAEDSGQTKDLDDEDQISLFDMADKAEVICKTIFPELAKAGVQEIAALTMSYFAAKLPGNLLPSENEIKAYLRDKRRAMDLSHKNDPIKSHRAYLRAVIKSDTDKAMQSRDLIRTEMIPHWMDPKRPRDLDEGELSAIRKMFAEDLPDPSDDP